VFQSPGLKRGATVTGVLTGQTVGTFNSFRFTGDGNPVAVNFTYDRAPGTDQGMNLQIGGPGGAVTSQTGSAPGRQITAPQDTISLTNPTTSQGSVEAFVYTQKDASYQIIVANYNPGFLANYSLSVQ